MQYLPIEGDIGAGIVPILFGVVSTRGLLQICLIRYQSKHAMQLALFLAET